VALPSRAVEVRREVRPRWPVRIPLQNGMDGVLKRRGSVLERLITVDGDPVVARIAQTADGTVHVGAWADTRDAAEHAIERMRFAFGVDDDLRDFHERFRDDPLLGRLVRANPLMRARRRPEPFEALMWAVTEQLIEFSRAAEIQRRLVYRLGHRCPQTGLREPPSAARVAAEGPAFLQSLDLSAARSLALIRAAREVAAGRIDLHDPDHERGWRRLRAIPGIGPWTVEVLAVAGQGRYDQPMAGDLGLLKLVGRLRTGSPHEVGDEDEVRELLARYDPWAGLAATYLLHARLDALPLPVAARSPRRAGTRSSARPPRAAAA
jgi:3-methyladenine DNA glycosylase/8-oxoguanine DNA glycosylase